MSYHNETLTIASRTSCDKPNCPNCATFVHFYGDDVSKAAPLLDPHNNTERWAIEKVNNANAVEKFESLGWTFWRGARTSYAYCQDHKPSATSRSVAEIAGHHVAAPCFHGKHETCDTVMKVSEYRKYRACKCECHEAPGGKK